jgi:hypothetical protein
MNKRLHFETGKYLFEKRGHAWALTMFAFDSYDEQIELESEVSAAGVWETRKTRLTLKRISEWSD